LPGFQYVLMKRLYFKRLHEAINLRSKSDHGSPIIANDQLLPAVSF